MQEAVRAKQAVSRVDPTVNLAADAGERFAGGFGSLRDGASDPAAAVRGAARDSIARDINRHAAVVLDGAPEALPDADGGGGGGGAHGEQQQQVETGRIAAALVAQQKAAAAKAAAAPRQAGDGSVSPERLQQWQERAASALEDLALDERDKQFAPLNIQDPRAYFDAGAAAGGAEGKQQQAEPGATAASGTAAAAAEAGARGSGGLLLAALAAIQPAALPDPPCDPDLASAVLLEVSQDQDEELVREFGPVAAAALRVPPHDRTQGLQELLLVSTAGGPPSIP